MEVADKAGGGCACRGCAGAAADVGAAAAGKVGVARAGAGGVSRTLSLLSAGAGVAGNGPVPRSASNCSSARCAAVEHTHKTSKRRCRDRTASFMPLV